MMFCPSKGRELLNVLTHNDIWANQKIELFVCPCTHATLPEHFPAFVGTIERCSKCSVDKLIVGVNLD